MSGPGQRVLNLLRQMILDGELRGGDRVAELPTAERLGVSRMPVRMALRTLEQEGLLERQGARGYSVRQMTFASLSGAVAVRGVLEGLAARQAAEKGISSEVKALLLEYLDRGDALFQKGFVTESDIAEYHDINKLFHQAIVEASGNPAIHLALSRSSQLPFASVSSVTIDRGNLGREYRRFNFAHMQHHDVVEAILNGHGARAESIMREHANVTLRYAQHMGDV